MAAYVKEDDDKYHFSPTVLVRELGFTVDLASQLGLHS
jgi:hypothetical protein